MSILDIAHYVLAKRNPTTRSQIQRATVAEYRPLCAQLANETSLGETGEQLAVIGVLHGLEKFDPTDGSSFEDVALDAMERELLNYLEDQIENLRELQRSIKVTVRRMRMRAV
jgi:DNA-directed RNA polymerase specialized sigma subunit